MLYSLAYLLFFAYIFLKWWRDTKFPHKLFPPGPIGFPLLGHLPTIRSENLPTGLTELIRKYGGACSVNLGPGKRIVIIGRYDEMNEVTRTGALTSRPPNVNDVSVFLRHGTDGTDARGLIFSSGEEWEEQRKFMLRSLRDLGFGKSHMENVIIDVAHKMADNLESKMSKKNVLVMEDLGSEMAGILILWQIMASVHLGMRNHRIETMTTKVRNCFETSSSTLLINVFPILRTIAPNVSGWKAIYESHMDVINFINRAIDHRKQGETSTKDGDNLIDLYLNRINEEKDPKSGFYALRGLHNLETSLLDMILAGIDTITHTLNWMIVLMMAYPDVQEKVQHELDQIPGDIKLLHKSKLPYIEAVICEAQRFGSVSVIGPPRIATSAVKVGNYLIPKGTTVLFNYFAVSRDPKYFIEPDKFMPERFLDSDGGLNRLKAHVPFGMGKRDCIGQSLGSAEVFILFTNLIKTFSFQRESPDLDNETLLKPKCGMTRGPTPYKMMIQKRSI